MHLIILNKKCVREMRNYQPDLDCLNKRRISRCGSCLWEYVTKIKKGDVIPAKKAIEIVDCYGIRYSDLIFFLSILGASVEMDGLYKLIEERENAPKEKNLLADHEK